MSQTPPAPEHHPQPGICAICELPVESLRCKHPWTMPFTKWTGQAYKDLAKAVWNAAPVNGS